MIKKAFKTILILSAVTLCLTVFHTQVDATETGTCGDNLYWELNDWGNLYIIRMYQSENDNLKALLQSLYTYHIAAKNYTTV